MNLVSIAKNYLVWHYSAALSDMFYIWWNYIWFVNHLFSVPDVIGSLFSPFKRLQEERGNLLTSPRTILFRPFGQHHHARCRIFSSRCDHHHRIARLHYRLRRRTDVLCAVVRTARPYR